MANRSILSIDNLSADAQELYRLLLKSSDLAAALLCASYLDAVLASLLHAHFAKSKVADNLLDVRGVLGTVSARLDLAYVLRLISKPLYQKILKILEIRNAFAHHYLEYTFKTDKVVSLLGELETLQMNEVTPRMATTYRNLTISARERFALLATHATQTLLKEAKKAPSNVA